MKKVERETTKKKSQNVLNIFFQKQSGRYVSLYRMAGKIIKGIF